MTITAEISAVYPARSGWTCRFPTLWLHLQPLKSTSAKAYFHKPAFIFQTIIQSAVYKKSLLKEKFFRPVYRGTEKGHVKRPWTLILLFSWYSENLQYSDWNARQIAYALRTPSCRVGRHAVQTCRQGFYSLLTWGERICGERVKLSVQKKFLKDISTTYILYSGTKMNP